MEENAAERQPLSPISSPASRSTTGEVGNEAVTTSTPDASTTSSRKRSISSRSDGRASQEPASKRQRTSDIPGNTSPIPIAEPQPQPESWDDLITARPYTKPLFDDEPMQLLQRSAALVLHHVGFDSASKEALESLCAQASAYAERFLSCVTESMLSSRRAQPIPLDYEYALRRHGLTDRLLRPHLKPPIPRSKSQLIFELPEAEEQHAKAVPELLGKELSGASDKLKKAFIPKKFPAFPSKHTYKATEVMPERETDPRKIREKATEAARHGEEALRRLVSVGKVGDQKGVRKALIKNPTKRLKHELWDKAMEDLRVSSTQNGPPKTDQDGAEKGILIDAGRKYGRQPTSRVRM